MHRTSIQYLYWVQYWVEIQQYSTQYPIIYRYLRYNFAKVIIIEKINDYLLMTRNCSSRLRVYYTVYCTEYIQYILLYKHCNLRSRLPCSSSVLCGKSPEIRDSRTCGGRLRVLYTSRGDLDGFLPRLAFRERRSWPHIPTLGDQENGGRQLLGNWP